MAIRLISEVCLFTCPTQLLLKVLGWWSVLGGVGTVRGTCARAADAGARRGSSDSTIWLDRRLVDACSDLV